MPTLEEHIQQTRTLFADATAIIEDVHEVAVAGQASGLSPAEYLRHAAAIGETAARLDRLASAIAVLLQEGGQNEDPSGKA